MKLRYIYSACVVIETEDTRILTDPWFTQGIYDGSWFQYPQLPADAIGVIGPVDLIYISHIHPDHYDVRFLHRYLRRFPAARIVIGQTDPPHLLRKMRVDGFAPEVIDSQTIGETRISIVPNHAYPEIDNVDTALAVVRGEQSVVNLNDNPFDPGQIKALTGALAGPPTVALLPYAGAGPYPQTYQFETPEALARASKAKEAQFLELYGRYCDELAPRRAIPFAGKYYLGGPLAELNGARGVADAVDAAALRPDVSVVLADGGLAELDVATLTASVVRTERYDAATVAKVINGLPFEGYDYQREIQPLGGRALPIAPLLASAYEKALQRAPTAKQYWVCLTRSQGGFYCFDTSSGSGVSVYDNVAGLEPRCEITIDERYLFGLLSRLYHWNNAEIGSHYRVRRVPDTYYREVFHFLNYLQV